MKKFMSIFAVAVTALLSGCQTDYTEEAADEARYYALDNLPGLSAEQRHFIKFTQPVLYSDLIFEQRVLMKNTLARDRRMHPGRFPVNSSLDKMHHCFVWSPPGMSEKVVVVGDGERSLRFWEPHRVIIKEFTPPSADYEGAKAAAVSYAMNKMSYLSNAEINRVRFSEPEVRYTRFPLEVNMAEVLTDPTPWESYLAAQRGKVKGEMVLAQLSLVWPGDKINEYIVISGFSVNGCLNGWKIQSARYVQQEDLAGNTLSAQEIAEIKKKPGKDEGKLIFPAERKPNRGNGGKESGAVFSDGLML